MLEIKDLCVSYGGIKALLGIEMSVWDNSIVTLIGSNGAGKSTTLKAVSGLVKYTGTIKFNDKVISGMQINSIIESGIVHVPEGRRIFSGLSVYENLMCGAYLRNDKAEIKKDIEWIFELFPRLKERIYQKGGTLSGGEQQMLAVGRGLMARPKLLMLDEPSLGLAPFLVQDIFSIIKKIKQEGVSILLVEQNANMALKICDYAYVLESGEITMQGKGEELLEDERVREAYLGKDL